MINTSKFGAHDLAVVFGSWNSGLIELPYEPRERIFLASQIVQDTYSSDKLPDPFHRQNEKSGNGSMKIELFFPFVN